MRGAKNLANQDLHSETNLAKGGQGHRHPKRQGGEGTPRQWSTPMKPPLFIAAGICEGLGPGGFMEEGKS